MQQGRGVYTLAVSFSGSRRSFRGSSFFAKPERRTVPSMQPALPTPLGGLWISPLHAVLGIAPVPAGGLLTTQIALPPAPPGFTVVLQSLVVQPSSLQLPVPVMLGLGT